VRTLNEQDTPAALHRHADFLSLDGLGGIGTNRDLVLEPLALRYTQRCKRTGAAPRLSRRADERPELHERLVELSDVSCRQQVRRRFPEPLPRHTAPLVFTQTEEPAEETLAVRFQDRQALLERLRQNSPRGIPADTGQAAHPPGHTGGT